MLFSAKLQFLSVGVKIGDYFMPLLCLGCCVAIRTYAAPKHYSNIMNGGVDMSRNSTNKYQTVVNPKIEWTLWDKITMPFYRARNFFRNKWWELRERCQRFNRGFAWSDVWDMDAWFISTTKPMLKHLLKKHWGHPCNIENEEWEAILQEMIDCLELMDEDRVQVHFCITNDDYSPESYTKVGELMEEKKNRFFELFSKWFFNLWD